MSEQPSRPESTEQLPPQPEFVHNGSDGNVYPINGYSHEAPNTDQARADAHEHAEPGEPTVEALGDPAEAVRAITADGTFVEDLRFAA